MISRIRQNCRHMVSRYRLYEIRPDRDDWRIVVKGIGIVALFSYFFYRSLLAALFMAPVLLPYYIIEKRKKRRRNAALIGAQFKDALLSVTTALRAGYAAENAFAEAHKDMLLLYGKNSLICRETARIVAGLQNRVILETLLMQFAHRSGNDQIMEFAEVFRVAKRSGGNMAQILTRTAEVIGSRLDTEKEIDVLLSAKKMEAKIMEIVPFFIVFYVGATSKGFFDPLYHNLFGILTMSVCLVLYLIAYYMLEKIVDIQI